MAFIDAHREHETAGRRWGVEPICEQLAVAPSTYYDVKSRPPSARALRDAELGPTLVELWKRNYSVYGRRKLTKAARRAGHDVGRDQVARLMRNEGIRGASRSKKRFTTKSDPDHVRAPDLVNRNFNASRPDELWVCDFTYCSTWSGIVYVAFVIDVFSRRLVGWKAARSMTTTLVVDALNMAAWSRRHSDLAGVTCHSDAGSQGGFERSSQHLSDGGVAGWGLGSSRRQRGRCEERCTRQGGRRAGSGSRFNDSGWRSPRERQARPQRSRPGWHPPLAPGGSERLAACDPSASPRCPVVTCP